MYVTFVYHILSKWMGVQSWKHRVTLPWFHIQIIHFILSFFRSTAWWLNKTCWTYKYKHLPSKVQETLKFILYWIHKLSKIQLLCNFFPYFTWRNKKAELTQMTNIIDLLLMPFWFATTTCAFKVLLAPNIRWILWLHSVSHVWGCCFICRVRQYQSSNLGYCSVL